MKKILLIFGLAAFSAASGQQKDVFDIGQHLRKKQADGKKLAEKKNMALPFLKNFPVVDPYLTSRPSESYTLPNGDKVIISSIDHMPCIQPDMRQFRVMPSVQPDIRRFRTMPNVSAQFTYSPGYVKAGQLPALSRFSYSSME
ncbi:MAG: hypothetical protein ABIT05_15575 [Chitinophagaceae bacterium]